MNFDIKKSRDYIIKEIRKHEPDFSMGEQEQKKIRLASWAYKVAVVAAIVILTGSILYIQKTRNGAPNTGTAYQDYATEPGKNLKLKLTDGSFIQLNGGSSIRFAEQFTKDKREVWLEGEAYCEIAKDKSRPFIVNVGDYKVEVLGTTFNVNSYKEDEYFTVALIEGRVKVCQKQKDSVFLNPGKVLSINKQTNKYSQYDINVEKSTGWKEKKYTFKNTPLDLVLKKMERRYGVIFETGDIDVSKFKVNATFDDDPLPTIIDAIEYGTGLKLVVEENNRIKIYQQ